MWEFVHKVQVLILNYSKVYKLWHLSFTYIVWTGGGTTEPNFFLFPLSGVCKNTPASSQQIAVGF